MNGVLADVPERYASPEEQQLQYSRFTDEKGDHMRRNIYLGLLASILLVVSGLACAQDAESAADVRCVIVGIWMTNSTNLAQRAAGPMLSAYYIGRLDGRHPDFDLENAIMGELPKMMIQAEFVANAHRCGRDLTAMGGRLTVVGKDLVKRGQEMQQNSNSQKAP